METTVVIAIIAVVFAAATFVLNIVVTIKNGQWRLPDRLNQLEARITLAVSEHREHTDSLLDKMRRELNAAMDSSSREFGESIHAIKDKVHQFELWARDNFVRRESFTVVNQETREAITKQGDTLGRGIELINLKIDGIISRQLDSLKNG